MSKAILVLKHMPRMCVNCSLSDVVENQEISDNPKMICHASRRYVHPSNKPNWCPLKPVPEYREIVNNYDDKLNGIDEGWNDCLDEILGG